MDEGSDTGTLLGRLGAVTPDDPGFDRAQLHLALSEGLAASGHQRLTLDETSTTFGAIGGLLAFVIVWGIGAATAVGLGTPWFTGAIYAFVVLIAIGVLSDTRAGDVAITVSVLAWAGSGLALVAFEPGDLWATHVVPVAIALLIAVGRRSLRVSDARDIALALTGVARSAPFVVPIVLIFLFLPALNADVWTLAGALSAANLIGVGVLAVGTLLGVVRLQLGRDLEPALSARASQLVADVDELPSATRHALLRKLKGERARVIRELPGGPIDEAWSGLHHREYVPYVVAAEARTLRGPLSGRLLVTTALTGVMLSAYTYVLLAVAVPRSVANEWTDGSVASRTLGAGPLKLTLPIDEYMTVAILFGIAATALFLAFVLTEERFAGAITGALLREPINAFLLLALPYAALTERVLSEAQAEESSSASASGKGVDSKDSHDSRTS